MAHQVPWNKAILQEFIDLAQLSEREAEVMRTRIAGMPRSEQAYQLHISIETLDRIIRRLKRKYDLVQPLSQHLPPRRFSAEETWMDSH